MTFIRFIYFLLLPILSTLAIPFLLVGWVVLAIACGLMNTWFRATSDPRYREFGITEFDR